jgi:hypothetical protein
VKRNMPLARTLEMLHEQVFPAPQRRWLTKLL